MKISREVSTLVMSHPKPHHYLRASENADRFPSFCVWPLMRTTRPLGASALEELYVEEGDELVVRVRLCLDRKPPNRALRLSRRDGSPHDEKVIWDLLRAKAGLEPAVDIVSGARGRRLANISALPKDLVKEGMTLVNVFEVAGRFVVRDVEAFARAYSQGVGRRFSYGYGLIEVEQ